MALNVKFANKQRFCDFCNCDSCVEGDPGDRHALCEDGRWICEVCYMYDECLNAMNHRGNPCDNLECEHRPRLMLPPVFFNFDPDDRDSAI